MPEGKPLIVVTNDDGIQARGLRALARALEDLGDVIVVAPADESSGVSHSLTIHRPVRIQSLGKGRFAVTGTPVDCVLFALQQISPRRLDLVISGINAGANLGDDTHYSGTVAAAREASLHRIPAIAASHAQGDRIPDYGRAAAFTASLAERVLRDGLRTGVFINLNFPVDRPLGVRITRQGTKQIRSLISEKDDPRGKKYYWIGEDVSEWDAEPDTDYFAVRSGYISLSPLQRDQTAHDLLGSLEELSAWPWNGAPKKKQ